MTKNKASNTECYQISDEESKRMSIFKVWLTIMVVFIHSYSVAIRFASGNVVLNVPDWLQVLKYTLSQGISRCAVPAFFLISAILLYRKPFSWKDNFKKKLKTLFIPYFILNTIWIFLYLGFQNIPVLSGYFADKDNMVSSWDITGWLEAYIGFQDYYPLLYPLWFLRDLFILNILATIIKKIVNKIPYISLFVFLALWLCLRSNHILGFSNQAICFWVFGCFIVNKNIGLSIVDKIKPVYLWIGYMIFLFADVMSISNSWHLTIHRINILVGIVFWFACMTKFRSEKINKGLLFVASYSFSIYLFHEMSLSLLQKLCAKLLPATPIFQVAEYLLIPVVIVLCCLILSIFMKRFMPHVYAIITGNRVK